MITYIALLRGINVSGKKLINMNALRQVCAGCGFEEVQTYIQSGNIVFRSREENHKTLEKLLTQAIQQHFGYDVPVIIFSLAQLEQWVLENPFAKDATKNPDFFHIQIMSEKPADDLLQQIDRTAFLPDTFEINGCCIYLYIPGGYGNTKLNTNFFEKKLKVSGSTRNWKTVKVLVEMGKEK